MALVNYSDTSSSSDEEGKHTGVFERYSPPYASVAHDGSRSCARPALDAPHQLAKHSPVIRRPGAGRVPHSAGSARNREPSPSECAPAPRRSASPVSTVRSVPDMLESIESSSFSPNRGEPSQEEPRCAVAMRACDVCVTSGPTSKLEPKPKLKPKSNPEPEATPKRTLPSYASLRSTSSAHVPRHQRMQRAFVFLQLPPTPALDQAISQAAQVTDQEEWRDRWVPPVHWLLSHRHHISLTRPFSVQRGEAGQVHKAVEQMSWGMDVPLLEFSAIEHFFDDWHHLAFIAARVRRSSQDQLTLLADSVHARLAAVLAVTPLPYYTDSRFHCSFLSALVQSDFTPTKEQEQESWTAGTPYDRARDALSNAELLSRRGRKVDPAQGIYTGTLPPPPGVAFDQPELVARRAQAHVGTALRDVGPVRPAALCLRLGREIFCFPLRPREACE